MNHGGAALDFVDARAAEVFSGAVSGNVRLRGKLVADADGRVYLVDASGRCEVLGVEPVLAHVWATVEGFANGSLDSVRLKQHGMPVVPARGGDLDRLQARGGAVAANLRLRAAARKSVRAFFEARGYLEVETPAIVLNPGSDLHLDAFEVHGLRERRFLSTSPELQMKRLVSAGLDRIYQLRYAYRRDEMGTHHEPEFTMLEWYRAFADQDALLTDTEALISHVISSVTGRDFIEAHGTRCDLTCPWPRRTIRELYRTHVDPAIDAFALPDDDFFQIFAERVQPALGHTQPVHVVDWPVRFASLARVSPTDPAVAERVETFIAGIELSNGFVELTDPSEQASRFALDAAARETHGKVVYKDDERFLAALRDGLPDTVGNALGFDRLVMLLAGASSIADVIAIPQERV